MPNPAPDRLASQLGAGLRLAGLVIVWLAVIATVGLVVACAWLAERILRGVASLHHADHDGGVGGDDGRRAARQPTVSGPN